MEQYEKEILNICYLEYSATHRSPEEVMFKPASAIPALHSGVQIQIGGIVEEHHAFAAELGVATDKRALQMRIDAISSDSASWAVAENLMDYTERQENASI